MLLLVTRVSVNGRTAAAGGIVVNTDFMSEIATHSSGASFKFFSEPEDRRGGTDDYVVSDSKATLLAQMNTSLNAVGLTLGIYPNNDSTQTAVSKIVNAKEIIAAYPHTKGNRTKCWIEVNEKGKKKKLLCNSYYVDIADLVRTGSTTTTTSSTTSTSTTSTSTTSTTT